MFEIVDIQLRNLAKTNHWQNLYNANKECSNIQLFNNVSAFSGLQIRFLHWLSVYSMLYEELYKQEDDWLSINVIESDIRCDAYLIYRNKKNEHLWKTHRHNEKMADVKKRHPKNHKDGKFQLISVDLRSE